MADNDVNIRFRVDETGAVKGFEDLDKALENAKDEAEKASDGFSNVQASIVTLNSALDLASRGFAIAATSLGAIAEAARQGSTIDDITNSFERLSAQAGVTAETLLNDLNKATEETVANTELMRIANEGLLAGLDPRVFDEVAQAARSYADSVGGDATRELEAFIQGLARGDDRFLKSRGILIDNEKAFQEYALTINKTADSLNELEKAEALKAAATRALLTSTQRLGIANKDIADSLDTLSKRFTDIRDKILKTIANNQDLKAAFDKLGEAMAKLPIDEIAAAFGKLITVIVKVTEASIAMGKALYQGLQLLGNPTGFISGEFERQLAEQAEAAQELAKAHGEVTSGLIPLKNGFDSIKAALTGGLNSALESGAKLWKEWGAESAKTSDNDAKRVSGLKQIEAELSKVNKQIASLSQQEAKAEASLKDLDAALGELSGGGSISILDSITGSLTQDLGAQILGNIIGTLKQGGLKGADYEKLGGQVGSQIGAALGESVGGPIGAILGQEVGSALGEAAVDLFTSPDSPGTKFRKEVDKFFAEAFEANRLQVIIDGQLREISDLDFGGSDFGSTESGFFAIWDTLGNEAKESFRGIAAGFAELTGQGQEFANNLAAAFSNNLGGSLNNLQLLVEATGKSFDDLKAQVREAFLDGKLSALETQTAFNGIARAAQKGIPDALGALDTAFENLKAAGVKGGRALIDALQDIGYEAKELGFTTLPQAQQRLAETGKFSADEIRQVFDTLATQGIDTIDELTSATQDQLIAVLSDLQANDFGFAKAVESAQELIDQVNKIPDRLEKTLVFNLKTNADAATRQAQRDGYIPNNATEVGGGGAGLAT